MNENATLFNGYHEARPHQEWSCKENSLKVAEIIEKMQINAVASF